MSNKSGIKINNSKLEELFIDDIIKDNKKIFKNISFKNNYTKKIIIRKYHLYNTRGIKLKILKLIKTKKLKGVWINKIFDSESKSIYYLYLLNSGIFCVIRVPNDIINTDEIRILKVEKPLEVFYFIDEYGNKIILNWNIDRTTKRLEDLINNADKIDFNINRLIRKFVKMLVKLTYK